jgi:hypothetical protein
MNISTLWTGLIGGPLIWLLYLQINYALVPWTCHSGHKGVLLLIAAITLVATAATGFIAWRAWHLTGANEQTEEGGPIGRSRFMALTGIGIAALTTLLVAATFIPIVVYQACD